MGGGAGVSISSNDLGTPYMKGADLHIPLESACLHAYEWGSDCTGYAGELVVVGFADDTRRLKAEDFNDWTDSDETEPTRNRGLNRLDGYSFYSGPVRFLFGGGYVAKMIEVGAGYDVKESIGLGFGVDVIVNLTLRYRDGHLQDGEGYASMWPCNAVFTPSKRMARLYAFCWEHWYENDSESDWVDCIDAINEDRYSDDPKPVKNRNRKKTSAKVSGGRKPVSKKKTAQKKRKSMKRRITDHLGSTRFCISKQFGETMK